MNMWGWEYVGRGIGMRETCEGTRESGAPHVHQPQGVHGLLSEPSKAFSQFFALRALKVWDVFILMETESAECGEVLNQASSHLQTLGVRLEKPRSSCRAPGAKVVLPFSDCFGWQLPPKEKKSPLPFPSHPLGSAHPRAEAAVWSQGGIASLEHPSGFAAFPVNPADKSWIRRTHGHREAAGTSQGFPFPSLVLSSCISPTLPSLLAASPSAVPGIAASRAPFWPSQVITKA